MLMFYGEILFWSLMGVKGFKKLRVVEVICNPAAGGWNRFVHNRQMWKSREVFSFLGPVCLKSLWNDYKT